MKKLLLIGTTAIFIAGVAGKAQAKVSAQKAAKEVIAICTEKHRDIHSEEFMLCVVTEPYLHKSCADAFVQSEDGKNVENMGKCAKPISDASIYAMLALRFNDMKPFPANNLKLKDNKNMEALFYNDRSLINSLNKSLNPKSPKLPVTKKNADDLRREWCSGTFRELGMPTQKVFDTCNRLFGKTTYALNFQTEEKKKVHVKPAQTKQKDPHKECLEARDYEGCMKVKTSGVTGQAKDKCNETGICTVTTSGTDSFGFPKPVGWKYKKSDEGNIYYFYGPKRIPHNGEQARYIGFERITRLYQNPRAGTSGNYIGGTSASTNCTGFGASVNCTTTGLSPTYIPGTSSTPGGVTSTYFVNVFDCKDMTHASYKNGKVWIGWKDAKKNKPSGLSRSLQAFCQKGDQYIIKNMNVLKLKL